MFSLAYRLAGIFFCLVFFSLGHAQDTSTSENSGDCEGSSELNITSNNINLDQKTMTFYLEGDIYVTGEGYCFTTDSEVSVTTNEQNPSEIDVFDIMGPFTLTLAREYQTQISANKGRFVEEANKFVFEGDVHFTNFYQGFGDTLQADRGEYFLSTDDYELDGNVILEIETIKLEASRAEFSSEENLVKFLDQVKIVNTDPNQQSEINAEMAEYQFDKRTMTLLNNVSGNYGPSFFSGRDRLVYSLSSEDDN